MSRGIDACHHWRQLASCRLDGELTEFESSGLERHCAGCSDCAAWMRELGYIADLIHTSELIQPGDWITVQRLRRRASRFPALAAASASVGAAFLAVIAIALPGRSGLIGEQAMTAMQRSAALADPPPRSLVLDSLSRSQEQPSHPAPAVHGPQLP